jgi:hypothetical protein
MKKSISSAILVVLLVILGQGCTTHSTNKKVFKAPGASSGKVIYESERFVDRRGR